MTGLSGVSARLLDEGRLAGMRMMCAPLVAALLGLCVTGCGGTVKRSVHEVPFLASVPYIKGDQDRDEARNGPPDFDDGRFRDYGRSASAADRRAITALLKRYYAAAATGDSPAACALTFSGLARSADLVDKAPEDYEPTSGSLPLRGKSCVEVMSALSRQHHEELTAAAATLVVIDVRVHGARGLAILGFRTTGERVIPLAREGGVWKVDGLFDSEIV